MMNGHKAGGEQRWLTGLRVYALAAFVAGFGLAISACGEGPIVHEFECIEDAGPEWYFCHPDAGDGGNSFDPVEPLSCPGDCIAPGPAKFRREPVLLWVGDGQSEPPTCPERASTAIYDGHSGLVAPHDCPFCKCELPECVPPLAPIASEGPSCAGPVMAPISTPPDWTGDCAAIAPPLDTIASVEIPTTGVTACQAVESLPPPKFGGSLSWSKTARACDGEAFGRCEGGLLCRPTSEPPPPGFLQCILYEQTVDEGSLPQCPDTYPAQFVFYEGITDDRSCTPCQCGDPVGAQCKAAVSAFESEQCDPISKVFEVSAELDSTACVTMGPMPTLAGLSASWVINEPGACVALGGEPTGEARPVAPSVFCCNE
jgi:hypothetical protein